MLLFLFYLEYYTMEKKTVLITGSTRGIGFALAVEFLKSGHHVIVNGRSEKSLQEAVLKLRNISKHVEGVAGSVTEAQTFNNLIEKATNSFKKIDIWINNAGIAQEHELFWEISDKGIKQVLDTNIYGLMLGTKYAIHFFKKQGFGQIFNMQGFGSNGKIMNKLTLYGTSKRAVNYFNKSISKELSGFNIKIGTINPGMVRTDFLNTAMNNASDDERVRYEKVYRILAEEPDVVAKFLTDRILNANKKYQQIKYLSGFKLIFKIVKLMINK